jgi:preprotein translocase subunit SecG
MEILLLIIHVLIGIAIIGVVLLQHGKGADMGAAFGSGSAGSLFGSSGSANFMSRTTAVLATVFFLTSLGLTYLGSSGRDTEGVIKRQQSGAQEGDKVPAVPAQDPTVPTPSAPVDPNSKAGAVPK